MVEGAKSEKKADEFLANTRNQFLKTIRPVFEKFKAYCEEKGMKAESYIFSGSERPYPAVGFRIRDENGETAQEIHISLSLLRDRIEIEKGVIASGKRERSLWDVVQDPSSLTQDFIEQKMNYILEDYTHSVNHPSK